MDKQQHKAATQSSSSGLGVRVQADTLEQLEKFAPLDELIAVLVGSLVRPHDRRLVIEVWTIHSLADLSADNCLINLRKREPAVAVDIDVSEELCAGGLIRHDQLWPGCHPVHCTSTVRLSPDRHTDSR